MHGFGIFSLADGRCYEGYWWNGKQHGLGTSYVPKKGKIKYGLWEDRNCIKRFNYLDISDIYLLKYDYKKFFKMANSSENVNKDANLSRPIDFNKKLNEVRLKIQDLRNRL
jgi:hypothetical protein